MRPILVDNCLKCHGAGKIRGDLDLSTRETLLQAGNQAPVVPGKAKASKLYRLITHQDKPHMPAQGPKLKDEQIARIAEWIDLGAAYDRPLVEKKVAASKKPMTVTDEDRKFWSFQPLKLSPPPNVQKPDWCRTPVDRFILAKLEAKQLTPNPELDRRGLLRRAYFDLLGLPPTPAEVEAFLADKSADAYEKLIDRLLASPHHGERWARHWLDLARFAESSGYEHDYDRPFAYHYRDFVIKAFNQDLPYDNFVKWQIAGDEYEPDNPLAMMATGFLAAGTHSTQTTISLVEKERYEQLDDKLRTLGTAFLGLTVGCARCHDHKYDPIPTRDYYRMLATFTTTVKSNIDVNLDPVGYKQALAKHEAARTPLLAELERYERGSLAAKFDRWLQDTRATPTATWLVLEPLSSKSQGGATFTKQDDGSLLVGGANPDQDTYTFVVRTTQQKITAVRLEALAHAALVKGGPGRAANGNFALTDFRVLAAPLDQGVKPLPVKLVKARATFEQKGLPVAAAIDADKKSGWAVDPQFGRNHAAVFEAAAPFGYPGGTELTIVLEFRHASKKHAIARPRLALSTQPAPALDGAALPENVASSLKKRGDGLALNPTEKAAVFRWWRTTDASWRQLQRRVQEHARQAPRPTVTKVLVASEGVPPLRMHSQGADFFDKTYFLKRGDVDQKDGEAAPGFLQVLTRAADAETRWKQTPPPGCRTSYRRRALAEWITDTEKGAGHLLARVIVNRLWQHHLGRGIVGTPSDFGFQGEAPTHPELLDYLAHQLIKNGWRLKPIHKLIMTSAVYRQSSAVNPANVKIDSQNHYFWHRPRLRLEAEILRDSLLAVSGRLDPKLYGPGTLDVSHTRRSIYFFVKRSKLIPSMVLFDAPDALGGMERRPQTTVAPQALWLLNDEQVRRCADALAQRVRPKEGVPAAEVVRTAYGLSLARPPSAEELAVGVAFLDEQTKSYQEAGRANAAQLATGDFCQALLGLNEFMYVD